MVLPLIPFLSRISRPFCIVHAVVKVRSKDFNRFFCHKYYIAFWPTCRSFYCLIIDWLPVFFFFVVVVQFFVLLDCLKFQLSTIIRGS